LILRWALEPLEPFVLLLFRKRDAGPLRFSLFCLCVVRLPGKAWRMLAVSGTGRMKDLSFTIAFLCPVSADVTAYLDEERSRSPMKEQFRLQGVLRYPSCFKL
jgi:hypothetical protein